MLARNAAMSAPDAILEVRPEACDPVRVRIAFLPFLAAVVHGIMLSAELAKRAISRRLIGADARSLSDELRDNRHESFIFASGTT